MGDLEILKVHLFVLHNTYTISSLSGLAFSVEINNKFFRKNPQKLSKFTRVRHTPLPPLFSSFFIYQSIKSLSLVSLSFYLSWHLQSISSWTLKNELFVCVGVCVCVVCVCVLCVCVCFIPMGVQSFSFQIMLNFCRCFLDLYRKWDRNSPTLNILNGCDIWQSFHGKLIHGNRVEKNRRRQDIQLWKECPLLDFFSEFLLDFCRELIHDRNPKNYRIQWDVVHSPGIIRDRNPKRILKRNSKVDTFSSIGFIPRVTIKMCWHNIESDPNTQTIMFLIRPNPMCFGVLLCVHDKNSQIDRQKRVFGLVTVSVRR